MSNFTISNINDIISNLYNTTDILKPIYNINSIFNEYKIFYILCLLIVILLLLLIIYIILKMVHFLKDLILFCFKLLLLYIIHCIIREHFNILFYIEKSVTIFLEKEQNHTQM